MPFWTCCDRGRASTGTVHAVFACVAVLSSSSTFASTTLFVDDPTGSSGGCSLADAIAAANTENQEAIDFALAHGTAPPLPPTPPLACECVDPTCVPDPAFDGDDTNGA